MDDRYQEILKKVWPEWELEKVIGSGAFGTVWQAVRHDIAGVTRAAIKIITVPGDDEDIEWIRSEGYAPEQTHDYLRKIVSDYVSEIQLMDSVKGYTNIVGIDDYKVIHSADEMSWHIFIRMELLQKVDFQSMEEADILRMGIEMCSALEVCRKKNIVHRDIKPDNILMNDIRHYKLGDFGVARSLGETTGRLSVKGTPNYMAPETYKALLRDKDIDAAAKADIYSLGMVLYWAANGTRLPFLPDRKIPSMADRENAFARRISGEQLPPPVNVSPELQQIILKACAYEPAERYASATEMREAFEELLNRKEPILPARSVTAGKGQNRILIPVIIVSMFIVLFATVILPRIRNTERSRDTGKTTQEAAEQTVHITLTVSDNLKVKDYSYVRDLLKKRLDLFADGKEYGIEEHDGKFDLFLPLSLFGEENIENIMRCYLSRPIRLYLQDRADPKNRYMEVPRDALESVTVETGTIPDVDASEYGVSDTTYKYIRISLSDEFAGEHGQEYSAWEKPAFAQDMEEFSGYYFYYTTFASGDGKIFYVLNHDNEGHGVFSDLVAFNLNNDPYPEAFTFQVDINNRVQWETADEGSGYKGKLQCGPEDFREATVTFSLKSTSEQPTEGEMTDILNTLRTNMDALGRPYALGVSKDESECIIAVKTLPDRINDETLRLIRGARNLKIRSAQYEESIYETFRLRKDQEGVLTLSTEKNWDKVREKIRVMGKQTAEGSGDLYLFAVPESLYEYPLLLISGNDASASGDTLPVELCSVRDGKPEVMKVTEENEWLIGFLQAVLSSGDQMRLLSFNSFQMNPDPEGALPDDSRLLPNIYSNADGIAARIREFCPEAEILPLGMNLQIEAHFAPDESLADKAADFSSRVFSALMSDDYQFRYVKIFLIDEDQKTYETARVVFSKKYGTIESSGELSEPGGEYACDIMAGGGRIEPFASAVREKLEQTEWYQKLDKLFD